MYVVYALQDAHRALMFIFYYYLHLGNNYLSCSGSVRLCRVRLCIVRLCIVPLCSVFLFSVSCRVFLFSVSLCIVLVYSVRQSIETMFGYAV